MKKQTLLNKALAAEAKAQSRTSFVVNEELVELAIEWGLGNVSHKQVCVALNSNRGNFYSPLALAFKHALETGRLRVAK